MSKGSSSEYHQGCTGIFEGARISAHPVSSIIVQCNEQSSGSSHWIWRHCKCGNTLRSATSIWVELKTVVQHSKTLMSLYHRLVSHLRRKRLSVLCQISRPSSARLNNWNPSSFRWTIAREHATQALKLTHLPTIIYSISNHDLYYTPT